MTLQGLRNVLLVLVEERVEFIVFGTVRRRRLAASDAAKVSCADAFALPVFDLTE